jgi:hypothetical protein
MRHTAHDGPKNGSDKAHPSSRPLLYRQRSSRATLGDITDYHQACISSTAGKRRSILTIIAKSNEDYIKSSINNNDNANNMRHLIMSARWSFVTIDDMSYCNIRLAYIRHVHNFIQIEQ